MHLTEADLECQHMLYNTPPNIEDCLKHRRANIIFKNIGAAHIERDNEESLVFNYCECCGRLVGKEPELRLMYNPIEAAYLGPGIPLFFAFFRFVLYMLVMYLGVFGVYSTLTNVKGSYCEQSCGGHTFWNSISTFNIFDQPQKLKIQMYFKLILIIITILGNIAIRSYMNGLTIYIDQFFAKPSDYSIMVRGIPEDADREDIQQMVEMAKFGLSDEELERTDHLRIVQVLMVRDLKEFLEIQKNNLQLIKKHIEKKQKNRDLGEIYFTNPIIPNQFARTAIVIFSNSISKFYFLESESIKERLIRTFWGSYYPKSEVFKIKNTNVSVFRAPEPDDLIWQNCGKSTKQLLIRRICLYCLSFVVLGFGFGIQYSIEQLRFRFVNPSNTIVQFLFSLSAAIFISTFNFLLGLVLQFLANRQGHDTKTQLRVAITFRIVFFQFLNSGVFVVMASILVKISNQKIYDFRKAILAYNIVQLMVLNAFNGNFMNFTINKFQLFKQYSRWQIRNDKKLFPQIQANRAFEPPSINIHLKYAHIFKTYWVTVFFMPIVPPISLISTIGLIIYYWVQKYLFSGVYAAPEAISSYLNKHILNLLDYTPLWMSFGSLFVHIILSNFNFDNIPEDIKNFHYLFLVLSLVNIFLPYQAILKALNSYNEPKPNQSLYQEALATFQLTYEDTNPIYLNHHKKRIRDQQIFRLKITKETEFQQMNMRLSQTQVLNSHKQSLLFKSSVTNNQIVHLLKRGRASSLNF